MNWLSACKLVQMVSLRRLQNLKRKMYNAYHYPCHRYRYWLVKHSPMIRKLYLIQLRNYMRKKLTTYPRSDCEYLPPNQYGDRNAILNNLQNAGDERLAQWTTDADRSIKSRAWNEKKITAHHAIIPTTVACNMNSLSREERNIYFLISQAYIAQFYGEHVYEQTKIVVEQCKEEFVANGRVVIDEGWKLLYKRQKSKSVTDNDEPDLTDERGAESDSKKRL